jgi:hypothetical protein
MKTMVDMKINKKFHVRRIIFTSDHDLTTSGGLVQEIHFDTKIF